MKTGLVLEGGALRTIFSAGVLDAFLDAKLPMPDYTIGVSAGAAYSASYLSHQNRRNLKLATTYVPDRRYMGLRNWLNPRNRSYFGLKFAYEDIPNDLLPFDYSAFDAYPGDVEAVVTNLNTGQADYLPLPRRDSHNTLLQATCAIPLLFPVYEIDGIPYLDGGCSDGIPWRHALEVGCDRVVVLLTRERHYLKKPEDSILHVIENVFRKYPRFVDTMRTRAERYNRCREELFDVEREGHILVLTPTSTTGFSRTERDLKKIRAMWQDGYFAGLRHAGQVRAFWTRA